MEERKICTVCGRSFLWRLRWRDNWPEVRFCSEPCARRRLSRLDFRVEEAVLILLNEKHCDETISPHDVSNFLGQVAWQSVEESTRMAARRLAQAGELEILKESQVIDPDEAEGAVELRLPCSSAMRDEALAS